MLTGLLLVDLLFHAYVPVGFMPAERSPFLLEICPAPTKRPGIWDIFIRRHTHISEPTRARVAYFRDPTDCTNLEHRPMPKSFNGVYPLIFLVLATILEVSGDAVVRMAIYNHIGVVRLGLFICGAALLFGYGSFLNLVPLEFGQVVGLYIATLFIVPTVGHSPVGSAARLLALNKAVLTA